MKAISILVLTLFLIIGCKEPTDSIPIPQPGLAEDAPAWSFKGDKIAFFSTFDSLGMPAAGIYISDSSGNSRKPINVFGALVKWLPGDSELVISTGFAGPGGFVIYNLNDGNTRSLGVTSSSPPFDVSRDGQFIYYLGPAIDTLWTTGIYRYKISDSSVLAIVDGVSPAVSSDGSVLVYARNTICTRIISGSTENCLPPFANNPSWPIFIDSGKSVIYDNGRGGLNVTDLSSIDRLLVTGDGPLSLSPDGLSILFKRPADDFMIHIWRINVDGTGLRQVTR